LELFIGIIDTELLEGVLLEVLEAIDIQYLRDMSIEISKDGWAVPTPMNISALLAASPFSPARLSLTIATSHSNKHAYKNFATESRTTDA